MEEYPYISDMLKSYFNIEGITERLRTCRQEDKRDLWNDMKILGKKQQYVAKAFYF